MQRMDECIDALGTAFIFSKLGANLGSGIVEIMYGDRGKTSFTSHHWLHRFARMLFGVHDVPGTFQ